MAHGLKYPNAATSEWIFDRRKGKRLFLNFSIEVSGLDVEGRPFRERTKTDDVSDRGCRLMTRAPVRSGDVVGIKLLAPPGTRLPEEDPHQFEVMWAEPTGIGTSIGTRKIEEGKIWKMSFPPPRTST